MPGFNQTGPKGDGALTGRERGMCRRTDRQSTGGLGSGRGRGMGIRGGAPMSGKGQRAGTRGELVPSAVRGPGNQLTKLKEQYQAAKTQLRELEEEIAALETGS
jgi:hypothetical protein